MKLVESETSMNQYYHYLCDVLDLTDGERDLFSLLFEYKFVALIPHDDNRAADGERYRESFMDETGTDVSPYLPFHSCTLFEMLVGLCVRLEFETAQSRWEKTPREWFLILMDNLGIKEGCTNSEIRMRVTTFISRHYKSNGDGGLFPLKNPEKDQRRIEIWWQMNAYVMENYPV